MCGFNGVRRSSYFRGETIWRADFEVSVGKLKNGITADRDEGMGDMINDGGGRVLCWILRLCNMTFERGVVSEDRISAVNIPLHKGKGERTECRNYKGICLLSMVGKIYAGILVCRKKYAGVLVDRARRGTEGLVHDEQRGFRTWKGCVDQIFT